MRRTDHRAAYPRSAVHAHDTALFVALELSRSTWLIGSSTPGSDRISKHQVPAADTTALLALLKRLKARAERSCGTTVGLFWSTKPVSTVSEYTASWLQTAYKAMWSAQPRLR